ncbi:TetR/AcrR family transcriptional regulator [Aliiglaciecola sp. CAU 1673]|uniref:TetR/AcrR family transcriptional regulator n=1 Tax=Aliiglaciecola sp. CAU 1673 TaxID=3032595 RepID=UPI0023D9BAB7|nr:TetR/AcrR family transcriptional regulator [Aliiglaciecola sp. CAU 1673]MDF2178387.1 TetR/AcrR family transcriptional regulator [Aliiglaciecola sp. CAU 1673]
MNIKLHFGKGGGSEHCLLKKFKNKREQAFAEREQELLVLAEKIMAKEGFSGLTMDKLVVACDYSKGTVYNHFSSKEDLLCALCVKSMEMEIALFDKGLAFQGRSRERLLAIYYAYRLHALMHPTLFYCVLTAKTPAVKEKASEARLTQQAELELQLSHVCDQLFEQGIQDGDLKLPAGITYSHLSFAAWALAFGSNALLQGASEATLVSRINAQEALLFNVNLVLDGMHWTPLSQDWDYRACWQRIGKKIFSTELSTLEQASA